MTTPSWSLSLLHRHPSAPQPRARIVCFPHAGAHPGFFAPWRRPLGADNELVSAAYPAPATSSAARGSSALVEVAERIAAELDRLPRRPTALFGHSLGAIVAYEVARRSSSGMMRLIASAATAPQENQGGSTYLLDDDALMAELSRLGGTSPEFLASQPAKASRLPAIRHDFRMIDTYRHQPGPLLNCPVTVFAGRDDPDIPLGRLRRWNKVTSLPCDVRMFPGGHFYLQHQQDDVLAEIKRRLRAPESAHADLSFP